MIKLSCIITDMDDDSHYSIAELLDVELSSVQTECMAGMNYPGDYMSIIVSDGVFSIHKSRIKKVKYLIKEVTSTCEDDPFSAKHPDGTDR